MSSQPNNPLHGLTLKVMLEHLVDTLGWSVLADKIRIRCFALDPSLDSSLKFLRRTPWARTKLELLYLAEQGFEIPDLKEKADKAHRPAREGQRRAEDAIQRDKASNPRDTKKTGNRPFSQNNAIKQNADKKTSKPQSSQHQRGGEKANSATTQKLNGQTLTLKKPGSRGNNNDNKHRSDEGTAHKNTSHRSHSPNKEQSDNAHIWGKTNS